MGTVLLYLITSSFYLALLSKKSASCESSVVYFTVEVRIELSVLLKPSVRLIFGFGRLFDVMERDLNSSLIMT